MVIYIAGGIKMSDLKHTIVEILSQPLEFQKRRDDLLKSLFHVKTKYQYKEEIANFFLLIGENITKLSNKSNEVIMRMISKLEINADVSNPALEIMKDIEVDGLSLADRDKIWNDQLALLLIEKLRCVYVMLGYEQRQMSPHQMLQQSQAIQTYLQVERLDMEKEQVDPVRDRELRKKLLE
jgi:hypothetical protein